MNLAPGSLPVRLSGIQSELPSVSSQIRTKTGWAEFYAFVRQLYRDSRAAKEKPKDPQRGVTRGVGWGRPEGT